MYGWLADALGESSQLVTASRRLARVLQAEYGQQQIAAGRTAWRTPVVLSWPDWVGSIIASATDPDDLPTRINTHQSRLLWERCLRREVSDPLLSLSLLAKQAGETYARIKEWRVTIDGCAAAAHGRDRRLFARAAASYESILERENWVDQAGLPDLALLLLRSGRVDLPRTVTVAGFDRIVPQVAMLLEELEKGGCEVIRRATGGDPAKGVLHRYESSDAELRAAGSWARKQLEQEPRLRIGIVVSNLEQDAPRSARLVKEGLVPGWQVAGPGHAYAVNVSYGKKLAAYPAVDIALRTLNWLVSDLSSPEISLLLRTPMLGTPNTDARSRLELKLRQLPDRAWAPGLFVEAFQKGGGDDDAGSWLRRIATLADTREQSVDRRAPSAWAALFNDVLGGLNWPGEQPPNSFEFQLVNRWRELLNELAHLDVVVVNFSLPEALARLSVMAQETVFQPEGGETVVQVLGPLEAAGLRFDKLWIAGLSASNWPPAGKPLPLVSRDLQRTLGMPDAEPLDTFEYAQRILLRLVASASEFIASFPRMEGDAEQSVTGLLRGLVSGGSPPCNDPHWYALQLLECNSVEPVGHDPAPTVADDELVQGGAATIQRQLSEPFTAFVLGRLGVRLLYPFRQGLAANVRGNLVHDALYRLYSDLPTSGAISSWTETETKKKIATAITGAFQPHGRYADAVLRQLLALEKSRIRNLLRGVVELDLTRAPFSIASVEDSLDIRLNGVRFRFRIDRIDQLEDGRTVILDYKTGSPRRLLGRDGEPHDMQLVAYTCAIQGQIAGIGLINIDSRGINIDAAGDAFAADADWGNTLAGWQAEVSAAAAGIRSGDVRLNAMQTLQMARPLALLSRIREIDREA